MHNLNTFRYLDLINRALSTAVSVAKPAAFTEQERAWFRAPIKVSK